MRYLSRPNEVGGSVNRQIYFVFVFLLLYLYQYICLCLCSVRFLSGPNQVGRSGNRHICLVFLFVFRFVFEFVSIFVFKSVFLSLSLSLLCEISQQAKPSGRVWESSHPFKLTISSQETIGPQWSLSPSSESQISRPDWRRFWQINTQLTKQLERKTVNLTHSKFFGSRK